MALVTILANYFYAPACQPSPALRGATGLSLVYTRAATVIHFLRMTTIVTPTEEPVALPESEPLGPLLKRAHKTANCLLRRILEPLGLTPVQATALTQLFSRDGLSLNELAERMQTDAPTLSGVVECLVTAGYAERRADLEDRRRLRLFATPKARQIQSTLEQAEARREAALIRGLEPNEVALLKALLLRVRDAVNSDETDRMGR
jgi:DNA-binding MarR family transcriptional regulator